MSKSSNKEKVACLLPYLDQLKGPTTFRKTISQVIPRHVPEDEEVPEMPTKVVVEESYLNIKSFN